MDKHIKYEIEFIPVKERLPEKELDGTLVLCFSPKSQPSYRLIAGIFVRKATRVTHWAELPPIKEVK